MIDIYTVSLEVGLAVLLLRITIGFILCVHWSRKWKKHSYEFRKLSSKVSLSEEELFASEYERRMANSYVSSIKSELDRLITKKVSEFLFQEKFLSKNKSIKK